jgi:hypothetical protein
LRGFCYATFSIHFRSFQRTPPYSVVFPSVSHTEYVIEMGLASEGNTQHIMLGLAENVCVFEVAFKQLALDNAVRLRIFDRKEIFNGL